MKHFRLFSSIFFGKKGKKSELEILFGLVLQIVFFLSAITYELVNLAYSIIVGLVKIVRKSNSKKVKEKVKEDKKSNVVSLDEYREKKASSS